MQTLFIAMFVACSAGILIFLVSLFRNRESMAPNPARHDAFLDARDHSPWPQAGQALGLDVHVDEPEVLLCRHVLEGPFQGRLIRLQSFDRKHAGQLGYLSAVRVGVKQDLPKLDRPLEGGGTLAKVHGVPCVVFEGERFLGDGLLLGKPARQIRQDGPWIELDGRCDPAQLPDFLEQALAVFSALERASHRDWVQAAEDHGLRLEWERERRVPRLAGLVQGVGVRVSWMAGGGARITLLSRRGEKLGGFPTTLGAASAVQESADGVVLTLPSSAISELGRLLSGAFAAL